jgi:hypothetical protein
VTDARNSEESGYGRIRELAGPCQTGRAKRKQESD